MMGDTFLYDKGERKINGNKFLKNTYIINTIQLDIYFK